LSWIFYSRRMLTLHRFRLTCTIRPQTTILAVSRHLAYTLVYPRPSPLWWQLVNPFNDSPLERPPLGPASWILQVSVILSHLDTSLIPDFTFFTRAKDDWLWSSCSWKSCGDVDIFRFPLCLLDLCRFLSLNMSVRFGRRGGGRAGRGWDE
jgi:hypothetical protein